MKVTAANQQLIALSCLRGQGINMYVACDQITQKLIESLLCCQRSDLGLFVFVFVLSSISIISTWSIVISKHET